jgi:hypothetical protein|tara:strand:+ start:448 stop:1176 length:729 start_codon:yes stop_codon:yes gene_type:complete
MKFFRTTRQTSLTEKKIAKYLIYAIGEIILVVIGILIALQVNNLNENRLIEELEISLLKEMKDNLRSDIEDIKINIGIHQRSIQSAKIILNSFDNELPDKDTLNMHYGKVGMIPRYLMTENAYSSMKKEGMRIIQNYSLKNAITNHYENAFSFLRAWSEAEWDTWREDQRELYRKHFKSFILFNDLVPADYDDLSTNSEYKNYLNNRIAWLTKTIKIYENGGIRNTENLIGLIEKELKNREK